jgi:hypothetical protein
VSADDEVVIYGVNKEQYSNDAFLGLPTDVLGMEYYAVTWYPPSQQCELMVVGVVDGTTVLFTFPSSMPSNAVTYNRRGIGTVMKFFPQVPTGVSCSTR